LIILKQVLTNQPVQSLRCDCVF